MWEKSLGLVRIEGVWRNRSLSEAGLKDVEALTDEAVQALLDAETDVFRSFQGDDGPELLASVPVRSRAYAAAWMGGQDVHSLASRATLWRHARLLREYGLNILEPRSVVAFPVQVRVVDLVPLQVPDWYVLQEVA